MNLPLHKTIESVGRDIKMTLAENMQVRIGNGGVIRNS